MLAQQILPVVVAIGGAHHGVDVLAVRRLRVRGKMTEAHRLLMIKFNQNHRTVDAIVEDAVVRHATDPGEARLVEVPCHFLTPHPRVASSSIDGRQSASGSGGAPDTG